MAPGWALAQSAQPPASPAAAATAAPSSSIAGPSATPAAEAAPLQEVVVTAQRRSENVQTLPIAITALSGGALEGKAVQRLSDLQYAAPGLQINDAGLTQSVNIRGIGLASGSPAVANGVATYVDGLFQPPILSTGLFYDIADVEVLRGPQGTLVGSNSTGGAIFINSENPHLNRFGGYLEGEAGTYSLGGVQGAVNLPVSDILAFRVAGLFQDRDSFYDSKGPVKTDAGELDERSGRISMLFNPGALQVLAKAEITGRNTGGFAYRPIPTTTFAPFAAPGGVYNLDYNAPTKDQQLGQIYSLEMRYTLPDGIVLRSISGWQNKRDNILYDTDAVTGDPPADRQTEYQFVREREASQEINILSPTGGRFSWILGGYYQHNRIDVQIINGSAGPPVKVFEPENKITTGVFGQANYKLTDTLELQVGLRYSHFSIGQGGQVTLGAGAAGFPPAGIRLASLVGRESDDAVTGKVDLNWQVARNNLLYAFAARGYKPGGVNSATSDFQKETVWDYEVGWKSTFFDGRVRTQVDGFYNDYDNFQFGDIDTTAGKNGITNFPTTTIKGVEGQVQARLGNASFDGGISYVDSRVGTRAIVNTRALPASIVNALKPQCVAGSGQVPGVTCFDYTPYLITTGNGPALLAPKVTFNLGAEYALDLGSGLTLVPRLNYAYVSSSFTTFFYSPVTDRLPAHGLLSALLTLRKDRWTLEAYVTNLTGEVYESGQVSNNAFYGAPRQGGVRLRAAF